MLWFWDTLARVQKKELCIHINTFGTMDTHNVRFGGTYSKGNHVEGVFITKNGLFATVPDKLEREWIAVGLSLNSPQTLSTFLL